MNEKKEKRTSDLNMVGYLEVMGIYQDRIEKEDHHVMFFYPDTEEIRMYFENYYNNTATVHPKQYADRLRRVRIMVAELLKR